MMTTISAFMVKTTPIAALKVRNMLISTPPAPAMRAAGRKGERGGRADIDAGQLRRDRIDRDRAQRRAVARAREHEIERRRR